MNTCIYKQTRRTFKLTAGLGKKDGEKIVLQVIQLVKIGKTTEYRQAGGRNTFRQEDTEDSHTTRSSRQTGTV
jgi:hypothetical protein